MPSKDLLATQLIVLPLTVSDLLVGLESDDTKEVIHQARILINQANECEAATTLLRNTVHEIEQTAISGNLTAVRSFVPKLHHHLQQALQTMRQMQSLE